MSIDMMFGQKFARKLNLTIGNSDFTTMYRALNKLVSTVHHIYIFDVSGAVSGSI